MIDTTAQKVRTFKDDDKVGVSFKDKEGVTMTRTLRVRTAMNDLGVWMYRLKSEDGTTFADGKWFSEEDLEPVFDGSGSAWR